jgi:hypothetical protein
MDHYEDLSYCDRVKVKYLRNRFDSVATLKPGNYFDLNKSSLISTIAVVTTYAVILLQFKQVGF